MLLSSCIGVKADIVLKAAGSGTITLEYRLSRLAESLGKLDGNERWPTVPLGKGDFERTAARIDGLTVRSFSTKNDGKDTINTITLDFADLSSLVQFFDATGQRAVLVQEQGKSRLLLTLIAGGSRFEPDVLELFTAAAQGYSVSLFFTAPEEGTLGVYDNTGTSLGNASGVTVTPKGKTVSFQSPLGGLFAFTHGARVELGWE
jgi:hypothetical protein